MSPALFMVSLVQESEMSNVVSENRPLLVDGIGKLLGVTFSRAAGLENVNHIVPSLPKNFAQQGANILIRIQSLASACVIWFRSFRVCSRSWSTAR
jgi:hypothetical protein